MSAAKVKFGKLGHDTSRSTDQTRANHSKQTGRKSLASIPLYRGSYTGMFRKTLGIVLYFSVLFVEYFSDRNIHGKESFAPNFLTAFRPFRKY